MNDKTRKGKSDEPKQKPVHEVRLGRIKATIWANDTESGVRHNVTLARLYKEGDEWKKSGSFGREDLPLVMKVADLAHTWIYQQNHENGSSNS
jgi:hypothetical protein